MTIAAGATDAYPIVRALLLGLAAPVAIIVAVAVCIINFARIVDFLAEWGDRAERAIARLRRTGNPSHGRHRVEDHPPQVGYHPPFVVAGAELPQRPKGNAALKAEIALGWRPYDGRAYVARVEMRKEWPEPEEVTGRLELVAVAA